MKRYRIAAAALLALAAVTYGQNAGTDMTVVSEMTVMPVTLHPKAIEAPVLQRTLLPRPEELESGNAAMHYFTAALSHQAEGSKNDERVSELLDLPLAQLTEDDVGSARLSDGVLHEMEVASKREAVDWDHNFRKDGFKLLLPGLSPLRQLARGVALEARVAVKAHRYEEAVRWLRVDYALARHIGMGDTIIEAMVGAAIAGMADIQLRTMMEQPDAPNMFWALATQPRLIDPSRAFQQERAGIYYTFPELKEVRDGSFHSGQWQAYLAHFAEVQDAVRSTGAGARNSVPDVKIQAGQVALGLALYGPAKAYLAKHGFKPEQIEAMPVEEVLMRGVAAGYEEPADETSAWTQVPYWQRIKKPFKADGEEGNNGNPLALMNQLLSPSLDAARWNLEKTERSKAVLATLEALRDYAAGHQGALPEKLEDILGLPIPVDPIWNRAFEYKKEGNRATLTSAPPSPTGIRNGLRVDITMEK